MCPLGLGSGVGPQPSTHAGAVATTPAVCWHVHPLQHCKRRKHPRAYLHVCARPPPCARPLLSPVRFQDSWSPLHIAASNGHTEAIKALLAAGAIKDIWFSKV